MEAFATFYATHGLWLTIIAVLSIILLGVLKYTNSFEKYSEQVRHVLYLIISVGLSIIGGISYMLITDSYDTGSLIIFTANVFGLNQMFYNIFKVTKLKDLFKTIITTIVQYLDNKSTL